MGKPSSMELGLHIAALRISYAILMCVDRIDFSHQCFISFTVCLTLTFSVLRHLFQRTQQWCARQAQNIPSHKMQKKENGCCCSERTFSSCSARQRTPGLQLHNGDVASEYAKKNGMKNPSRFVTVPRRSLLLSAYWQPSSKVQRETKQSRSHSNTTQRRKEELKKGETR